MKVVMPCFGIVVTLTKRFNGGEPITTGTIESDLHDGEPGDDAEPGYDAAMDGIESLILAHACAGVDVAAPAYVKGIETAVEAVANHM